MERGKLSNELKENNAEIGLELAQSDFQTVVQKEIDNELVVNVCNNLKKSIVLSKFFLLKMKNLANSQNCSRNI